MDIHETPKDVPETLRNIHLSNQLAPFSGDVPRNIPGNIPLLARAFSSYYCPALGIFMEKRKKNGTSLLERRISSE